MKWPSEEDGRARMIGGRVALRLGWCIIMGICLIAGCRQDMHDQPRYEPLESSHFFDDGRASRPLVEGTVAQGQAQRDTLLSTGKINNTLAAVFPFPVTRQLL